MYYLKIKPIKLTGKIMKNKKYITFFVMLFITIITCSLASATDTTDIQTADTQLEDTSNMENIQTRTLQEDNNLQEVKVSKQKETTKTQKNIKNAAGNIYIHPSTNSASYTFDQNTGVYFTTSNSLYVYGYVNPVLSNGSSFEYHNGQYFSNNGYISVFDGPTDTEIDAISASSYDNYSGNKITLDPGLNTLYATYSNHPGYESNILKVYYKSSSAQLATTTSISTNISGGNTVNVGDHVTFYTPVSSSSDVTVGLIELYSNDNLGTSYLVNNREENGQTLTGTSVQFTTAGTYKFMAKYVENEVFKSSQSNEITIIVKDSQADEKTVKINVDAINGYVGDTKTVTIQTTPNINQGIITVKKDGQIITTVNLAQSNSFDYLLTDETGYTLTFTYEDETGEYTAEDATATVTTQKYVIPFTMQVDDIKIVSGETKKVTINTNTTVNQGTVTVKKDNDIIATVNLAQSNTFDLTYNSNYYYPITLTFTYEDENGDYTADSTTAKVTRRDLNRNTYFNYYQDQQKNVEYDQNTLTTHANTEESLYVTVENSYSSSSPITTEGNITVTCNDIQIAKITNPNSITQPVKFTFTNAGEYTLTFDFETASGYYDGRGEFTVVVLEEGQAIPITIDADDIEATVGDTKTVSITTTPEVNQGTITVKKDDQTITTIDLSQTNSFDMELNEVTQEPYTLTISYNDPSGKYQAEDKQITVTVNKVITPFTMQVDSTRMMEGQTKTFTINTNTTVKQGIVTVKNKDTLIAEVDLSQTNTFNYTYTSSSTYSYSETLTLTYTDSQKDYQANNTTVRIEKRTPNDNYYFNYYADEEKQTEYNNELTTTVGKQETIYVEPQNYYGTITYAGNITATIDGQEIASITNPNSITQPITFSFNKTGVYNITFDFMCSYSSYDIVQNFTVTVVEEKIPVEISAENINATVGDVKTVTINTNPQIQQGTVTITKDDQIIATVDLSQSNSFELELNEITQQPYTLILSYEDESNTYEAEIATITVTVNKKTTPLAITVDDFTIKEGQTKTVTINTDIEVEQGIITITDNNGQTLTTVDLSNADTFEYAYDDSISYPVTYTISYNDQDNDYIANDTTFKVTKKAYNANTYFNFYADENKEVEYSENNMTTIINRNVPLYVTVENSYSSSSPLTTEGNITITLNGEEKGRITNPNSISQELTFGFTQTGTYVFTFEFETESGYFDGIQNFTFEVVEPTQIEVTADAIQTTVGMTKTITINTKPKVEQGIVTIKDNDETIAIVNLSEGNTFEYTTSNTKSKTLTINYVDEQGLYYAIDSTTTVTVTKQEAIITIDEVDATAGQNATITAHITDKQGNMVNGGKVIFKINGKTIKDDNGKVIYVTVENGLATLDYYINLTWKAKELNITAVYSGTTNTESARNSTNTLVKAPVENTKITITPFDEEVKTGSNITLKVQISNNDMPITGGRVVFKLNGKTLKDENGKVLYFDVDDNGIVTYNYNIGKLKAKSYKVEAIFISTIYDRISDSTTLNVIN